MPLCWNPLPMLAEEVIPSVVLCKLYINTDIDLTGLEKLYQTLDVLLQIHDTKKLLSKKPFSFQTNNAIMSRYTLPVTY